MIIVFTFPFNERRENRASHVNQRDDWIVNNRIKAPSGVIREGLRSGQVLLKYLTMT